MTGTEPTPLPDIPSSAIPSPEAALAAQRQVEEAMEAIRKAGFFEPGKTEELERQIDEAQKLHDDWMAAVRRWLAGDG
jgi:hypothetical protein